MSIHVKTDFQLTIPRSRIKPVGKRWRCPRTTEDAIILACRLSTQHKRPYYVYGTYYGPTVTDNIVGVMQQYYRADANIVSYYDLVLQRA